MKYRLPGNRHPQQTHKAIALFFLFFSFALLFAQGQRKDYLSVELISETASIQPGQSFNLGLHFVLDNEWHIYWKNPGDAGMPVSIDWQLPPGFEHGEIQWPYPKLIKSAHLANFSYDNEVLFIIAITPPTDLKAGESVTINANAKWLVCKEDCTPGKADLKIAIPVSDELPKLNANYIDLFYRARFDQPLKESGWSFSAAYSDSFLHITAASPEKDYNKIHHARFFPLLPEVIINAADQRISNSENGFTLKIPLDLSVSSHPKELNGVIVTDTGWRGNESEKAHNVHFELGPQKVFTDSDAGLNPFLLAILFAFLGGIILNLMPCVLPVLSIKILGFVNQGNGQKNQIFKHGLFFSAGVLISFWILAAILIILQSAGQQIGWGFQLQQPLFLFILIIFFFLFGLNLFGVFEIGTTMGGIDVKSADRRDLLGSFVNGMIATLVATPCTAPFMGSALGYAVSRPPYVALTVFTFLGLGMSSPYLLLSAKPSWLKFIPKPGEWMESMKQFFGFLLLGTVIWLLWVLGIQRGNFLVIQILSALLFIGIGAWIYGRWGRIEKKQGTRRFAGLSFILLILLSFMVVYDQIGESKVQGQQAYAKTSGIQWQKYSRKAFSAAVNSDNPVFIDFTAAWCLSCQVNEKVALEVDKVQQKFMELGIIPLKADWTNRDDEITAALAAYGRNSVPLYVIYGKDRKKPVFLPEIITPGIVLDALEKLKK